MMKLALLFCLSLFAGNKMDPPPSIKDSIEKHNKAAACSGQKESLFRSDVLDPLEAACNDNDKRLAYDYMKCMVSRFCEEKAVQCDSPKYSPKCERAMDKAFRPLYLRDPEVTIRNFENLNNKAKVCAGRKVTQPSETTVKALASACSWDDMQILEDHANCEVAKYCAQKAKNCQYPNKKLSSDCNKAVKNSGF